MLEETKNDDIKHCRRGKNLISFQTMQLPLPIITLLFSLHCVLASDIVFIFNNGFSPSQTSNCDSKELVQIDAVFTGLGRRFLRSSGINGLTMNETSLPSSVGERDLSLRECVNNCQYYASGSCRARHCLGWGRALSNEENDKGDRSLKACDAELNEIHTKLDSIRNSNTVSLSCKNFLEKSKRLGDCYDDDEYGQVTGIRVWKVSSSGQTIVHSFVAPGTSATICKSLGDVGMESLNAPCVPWVKFRMTGTNNYVRDHDEGTPPFSLFGDDGFKQKGASLNAGVYTLSISPENDPARKKDFTINVSNKC